MGGARSTHQEIENTFIGDIQEKRPFGRPSCRQKDNINMDFKEMMYGNMEHVSQMNPVQTPPTCSSIPHSRLGLQNDPPHESLYARHLQSFPCVLHALLV